MEKNGGLNVQRCKMRQNDMFKHNILYYDNIIYNEQIFTNLVLGSEIKNNLFKFLDIFR